MYLGSIMNSNFIACPARSLEMKNTPVTAKFLGSNLTRNSCFYTSVSLVYYHEPFFLSKVANIATTFEAPLQLFDSMCFGIRIVIS